MPMLQTPIDAEAGAATNGGRRPTVVAAPASVSPELSNRPRRRTFTAKDKLRILADVDRAVETGGIGAVLRREGLYSSALSDWRRQRDAGGFNALVPARRGPKAAEPNALTSKMAAVAKGQCQAHATPGARRGHHRHPKKVAALLGIPLAPSGRRTLTEAVVALAPAGGMTAAVCAALGISRASVQRKRARLTAPPAVARLRPRPARSLSVPQRQVVLDLLHAPRFADQAPAEIDASLLDEGAYHSAVQRSAAPNYVTATASNGARLELSYNPRLNMRPWGKTFTVAVGRGFLSPGDIITVRLGDRSGGSPGIRLQTFCEDRFEIRVLADVFAT